jgi:hypothetical protein
MTDDFSPVPPSSCLHHWWSSLSSCSVRILVAVAGQSICRIQERESVRGQVLTYPVVVATYYVCNRSRSMHDCCRGVSVLIYACSKFTTLCAQALMYPLLVACKSQSTSRRAAAMAVVDNVRLHSATLVQQAQLVSAPSCFLLPKWVPSSLHLFHVEMRPCAVN